MPDGLIFALIAIPAALVVFLIIVALRPSEFRVARSIDIAAPPERPFDQVNDLQAWRAWSPWEGMDPNLQRTYGSVTAGVGATYGWKGDGRVGEGRMTIEKSERPSQIGIKLEFVRPWVATNAVTFAFGPARIGTGTKVVWTMEGRANFVMKTFELFGMMEAMVGRDFERGLASLKAVVEGTAPPPDLSK